MKNILIYQMGKVASSTVYGSIGDYLGRDKSFVCPPDNHKDDQSNASTRVYHSHRYEDFSPTLKQRIKTSTNKVITLVREPISRNISGFFEDPTFRHITDKSINIDELTILFLRRFNHTLPLEWFDNQLKRNLGIDIYSTSFNKEKGYGVVKSGNTECMVIRADKLNNVFPVISQFLEVPLLSQKDYNITQTRPNGVIYKKLQEEITLPPSYIKKMYDSKLVTHFFTEKEIEGYKKKWLKKEVYEKNT